MVATFVCIYI